MEQGHTPDFIREFSKEEDIEGRKNAAIEIKQKRQEYFNSQEYQKERQEEIEKLQITLEDLDKNWVNRLFRRAQISQTKEQIGELQEDQMQEKPDELSEAKDILRGYYEGQKTAWQKAGYEPEDVKRYFTEENLENLSLEDYTLLLSRFPCALATHVTRYGVRDHTGMMEHRAGLSEFSESFLDILEDGRLRSVVGKFTSTEKKDEALSEYFKWYVGQVRTHCPWIKQTDREIIESNLEPTFRAAKNYQENQESVSLSMDYVDKSAVHLARDAVLDEYYGGEHGNEMFFVYPLGHFFAEHQFIDSHGGVDKNNDMYIWTKENKGLSVNAAVSFIPQDTLVDRQTGSRYKTDEERNPIPAQERIEVLEKLFADKKFIEFLEDFYKESREKWIDLNDYFKSNTVLEPRRRVLKEEFSIQDDKLIKAILNTAFNQSFQASITYRDKAVCKPTPQGFAEDVLMESHCYFQEATDTIPAQEYWENYFKKNPDQRPSKIVYYTGSPNQALGNWKREGNLIDYTKTRFSEKFRDYHHGKEGESARVGSAFYDVLEYASICDRVLEKYFSEEKVEESEEEQLA